MNLLPPIIYGVDIALSKLRPNATYQLEGKKFTVWNDPTGSTPPTWDEIYAQIANDQKEAEAISKAHKEKNQPVADLVNSFSAPVDAVKLPPAPAVPPAASPSAADVGYSEPIKEPDPPNM